MGTNVSVECIFLLQGKSLSAEKSFYRYRLGRTVTMTSFFRVKVYLLKKVSIDIG